MINVDDLEPTIERTAIWHLQRCTGLGAPSRSDRYPSTMIASVHAPTWPAGPTSAARRCTTSAATSPAAAAATTMASLPNLTTAE